jgi:fibronectin type 3 domain-containing protein
MRKALVFALAMMVMITGLSLLTDGVQAVSNGPPGTPTGTPGIGTITLHWDAAPGTPTYYYVHGSATLGGTPTYNGAGWTSTSWTVDFLTPGTVMYFYITADYAGTYYDGPWSGPLSPLSTPSAPQNLQAAADADSITLTWEAPASLGGGEISNYYIYRSTASGSESQIDSVSGSTLTYDDQDVSGGHTYYYKVAAYNWYTSPMSNEASATEPLGKPGTVQNLWGSIGTGNISLTWTAPASDGGSAISNYNIYRSTTTGAEILIGSTGGANRTYEDHTVQRGQTYYYQVTAENAQGEGAKCGEISILFFDPPTVPLNLQLTVESDHIALNWQLPIDDGGSPIAGYNIYRLNVSGGTGWEYYDYTDGPRYYNDTLVQLGCTYHYKVTAYSDYVEGPMSEEVSALYDHALSEPYNVNLSPGADSILVTWSAPNSTGSSPIVEYWVFWGTSPGARTYSASAGTLLSYTITGVVQGTNYYVTIAANNSAGRGPFSSEVHILAPTVPDAVGSLDVTRGDGQAIISWEPPSEDGGSAVTKYVIYRGESPGGETYLADCGSNCTWTDGGLVNGHTYYYVIEAVNLVGAGSTSNEVSVVPARAPTAPTDLVTEGGIEAVYLNWSAPADMGGGVNNYTVLRGTDAGTLTPIATLGNVTTYVDRDVIVGVTYYYCIVASNWAGDSTRSDVTSESTIYAPTAPVSVTATAHVGYVHLTWSTPSPGNSPLLGYRIYRSTASGEEILLIEISNVLSPSPMGQGRSYDDHNVVNGTTYYYKVMAYNRGYESALSGEASARPYNVPSVPTDVVVIGGLRNLTITWAAPASDNGAAVTGYWVLLRNQAGDEVRSVDVGLTTSYSFEGLDNATRYSVQALAYNLAGNGSYCTAVDGTTYAPPQTPVASSVSGNEFVTVSWSTPPSDAPILGYNLYRGTASGVLSLYQVLGGVSFYDDTAVTNGQSYFYAVAAFSDAGESGRSAEVTSVPSTVPGAPIDLAVVGGIHTVTLTWNVPASNGGLPVTAYNVYRGTSSGPMSKIATVTALSYADTTGVQGIEYEYQVVAVNDRGEGASSSASATALFPPPTPTELKVVRSGNQAVLTWTMPEGNTSSGSVSGFAIYRIEAGSEVLIGVVNESEARSFTDTNAPEGAVTYRVAAMNSYATADQSSLSEGAGLSANMGAGTLLLFGTLIAMAGILLLSMIAKRRKKEQ